MGKDKDVVNLREAIGNVLLSADGFVTLDEIISLIGLTGRSRTQEDKRGVVRTQIQRLRRNGLNIETRQTPGQRSATKGNTTYRLVEE